MIARDELRVAVWSPTTRVTAALGRPTLLTRGLLCLASVLLQILRAENEPGPLVLRVLEQRVDVEILTEMPKTREDYGQLGHRSGCLGIVAQHAVVPPAPTDFAGRAEHGRGRIRAAPTAAWDEGNTIQAMARMTNPTIAWRFGDG